MISRNPFRNYFCFVFCCLNLLRCHAWWNQPHMIVAAVAEQELDEKSLKIANSLLLSLASQYPKTSSFVSSGRWADMIKKTNAYGFQSMHYIDFGYTEIEEYRDTCGLTEMEIQNGEKVTSLKSLEDRVNILSSLKSEIATLGLAESTLLNKAISVRFVIHLMGDVHQPLHCITRCTNEHKFGDFGGNAFALAKSEVKKNLHQFWDSAGGQFVVDNVDGDETQAKVDAKDLLKEFPCSGFPQLEDTYEESNIQDWIIESHVLGIERVYKDIHEGVPLNDSYIELAQSITRAQISLAGCRLALVLKTQLNDEKINLFLNPNNVLSRRPNHFVGALFLICIVLTGAIIFLSVKMVNLKKKRHQAEIRSIVDGIIENNDDNSDNDFEFSRLVNQESNELM